MEQQANDARLDREFQFSHQDFEKIRGLVKAQTGINLSDGKVNMVYSRLARRLRELKLSSFREYLTILEQGDEQELVQFVNAITTNLTSFFREPHHFEFLAKTAVPEMLRGNADEQRIRVWSAGCSTGEEPYSIAITLRESIPNIGRWDVKLLATDLDSSVLEKAEQGVYATDRINGVSEGRLSKWFRKGRGDYEGMARVADPVRELVTFRQLNLMHQWPMRGPFDAIFCRNVVIYFDKDTQRQLFDRMADLVRDGGYLFIGHSETLYKVCDRFQLIGGTVYQKVK